MEYDYESIINTDFEGDFERLVSCRQVAFIYGNFFSAKFGDISPSITKLDNNLTHADMTVQF